MIDDIGLGEGLANIVYLLLIIILTTGLIIFLIKKKVRLALLWVSVIFNILTFLFFLGTQYILAINFATIIWPLINIYLIYCYIKSKK